LTPDSIRKVLSTFRRRRLKALLMGGQACILYGGAEFSRDVDFAVAASSADLARLRRALADLKAEPVYFPPLSAAALRRGHACHFRCRARGVDGLRIDVMGRMRGADPFPRLWLRRTLIRLPGIGQVPVVSLPDLVRIKQTQRDKDWIMVRRLVEADFESHRGAATGRQIRFWLSEARTAPLLKHLVRTFALETLEILPRRRAVLSAALRGTLASVEKALKREEARQRLADRRYWAPLKRELEAWRTGRRS
jgi:hypothetical protein